MSMEHFGLRLIKRKYSFNLKREEFAIINTRPSLPRFEMLVKKNAYSDDSAREYKKEWCEEYRQLCLRNYDLNMKYFNLLDYTDFDKCIEEFLIKHSGFHKVENLLDYDGVAGYYMMVLDGYKQVYIGKSNNIKKRIQTHWSCSKPFDRTLFPMYATETSCFSIDFFRALDTTRIFTWKRNLDDQIEQKLIESFPQKYCTNRVGGDVSNGIEALCTLNKRELEDPEEI